MITKHLLVVTFCMGFITILISNTGLAFAVMCTPQYNAGYTAACSDAKSGLRIWEYDGFIWEGFYQKYPNSLTNNTQWMDGYTNGSICNHKHTPQYNTGFNAGCHDKKASLLLNDENGYPRLENFTLHPNTANNTEWMQGFEDSIINTHSCPDPKYG